MTEFWNKQRVGPALALLGLLALPSVAQGPAAPHPFNGIYLGNAQVLDAAAPRQLSLNAHVRQFAYQPGGLEIAYSGAQYQDGQITSFVKLAGIRRGETLTLATKTSASLQFLTADGLPDPERQTLEDAMQKAGVVPGSYTLAGWSADGRYLLIKDDDFPDGLRDGPAYLIADVGATVPQAHPISRTTPGQAGRMEDEGARWSPDRTRIAFTQRLGSPESPKTESNICTVYDPAQGKVTASFALEARSLVLGWLDGNHLLLTNFQDKPSRYNYLSHDLVTGQDTPADRPANWHLEDDTRQPSPISPKNPAYQLDTQPHQITDAQKVAAVDSNAVWVRRTKGPKTLSAVAVTVTPGTSDPQPRWSPTGTQVAYLAHGDLFVTDLITRSATVRERYAAGDRLPCPEERQLAASNLKQIGLALRMYSLDYDGLAPPADSVNDQISPYVKNSEVFEFGDVKFAYQLPAQTNLSKVAKPVETVLGTYNVPCAKIVLYADGHVQEFPRQGTPGAAANQ